MIFQSPGAIAFQIGPLTVHWYGILIGLGIILCYWYISREVRRRKLSQKHIDDMAFWVIIAGVIGARLYYVLFNLSYFSDSLLDIFKIWKGGLAIHGALIGGALAYTLYIWMKKIPWMLYADVIMPGVLLAQALGRWGNFFNSEAFGRPTNLPWKLFIPEASRPEAYLDFSYFHPTFLYESLWNFFGFLVLFFLSKKLFHPNFSVNRFSGAVFFSYLIFYSLGRFFIEGLRTDSLMFGSLRAAQIMSLALFLIGIFGCFFILKKRTMK